MYHAMVDSANKSSNMAYGWKVLATFAAFGAAVAMLYVVYGCKDARLRGSTPAVALAAHNNMSVKELIGYAAAAASSIGATVAWYFKTQAAASLKQIRVLDNALKNDPWNSGLRSEAMRHTRVLENSAFWKRALASEESESGRVLERIRIVLSAHPEMDIFRLAVQKVWAPRGEIAEYQRCATECERLTNETIKNQKACTAHGGTSNSTYNVVKEENLKQFLFETEKSLKDLKVIQGAGIKMFESTVKKVVLSEIHAEEAEDFRCDTNIPGGIKYVMYMCIGMKKLPESKSRAIMIAYSNRWYQLTPEYHYIPGVISNTEEGTVKWMRWLTMNKLKKSIPRVRVLNSQPKFTFPDGSSEPIEEC